MAINRQEVAAARLRERQERADAHAEQRRINERAEATGAGGVVVDKRDTSAKPLAGKALSGPAENKAAKTDGGDLDSIDFASPAARQAALDAGLSAKDFKRAEASSDNGFTAADVRGLVGE